MPKTTNLNWLGFLTEQRKQRFWIAMDAANKRHRAITLNNAHIYQSMSERGKASDTREWYMGYLMDAFSTDDGAKRRNINGIYGIEFDQTYFLYSKKLDDPNQPPPESKTVSKAKRSDYQPLLDPVFEDVIPPDIPLQLLFPILAGYVKSEGLITDLFFIEQDGKYSKNVYRLEDQSVYAPEPAPVNPEAVPLHSKTTFVLKSAK